MRSSPTLSPDQTRAVHTWAETHAHDLVTWRTSCAWPQGMGAAESARARDALRRETSRAFASGTLRREHVQQVHRWGFRAGRPAARADACLAVLRDARRDEEPDAVAVVKGLIEIQGVGISTANKFAAMACGLDTPILDSRAADGLSDLVSEGERLLPIPAEWWC